MNTANNTMQAYRLAIDLGVQYVEPDLVLSKDGVLVREKSPLISIRRQISY